jgi:hypothetical protein
MDDRLSTQRRAHRQSTPVSGAAPKPMGRWPMFFKTFKDFIPVKYGLKLNERFCFKNY